MGSAGPSSRRYRTVFISGRAPGHPGHARPNCCSISSRSIECDTLFLVGDIVVGWRLKGGWLWPQAP